tara:strand:- start:1416 stop:1655 length:240 start_codon:yes stop_codon:yes gene_type:complete
MLKWDGFDNAIIGVGGRCNTDPMIVYDYDKMVDVLVMRDGMAHEEAEEYIDFNIVGAWIGDTTPIIVNNKSIEEIEEEC